MTEPRHRLAEAYARLLERLHLHDADRDASEATPPLRARIDRAAADAHHLGELTKEEAGLLAHWARRDLADAGRHLAETGQELGSWLRFDTELVEERLLDWFGRAADQSRLELLEFADTLERLSHYETGEVTGPGTLACEACGERIEFRGAGTIPSCPKCGHTRFERPADPA
ncbi:MAG: zinc ribbon-containing protein [Proteobacteria bacterium]|nr:zinc ribbon-containing protein [Pseudomonadota bacterium]